MPIRGIWTTEQGDARFLAHGCPPGIRAQARQANRAMAFVIDTAVAHAIAEGSVGAYYPEANVLVAESAIQQQ